MCNAFLHFYVFISTYWGVYVFMYIKCAALTHCHKWTRLRLMYFYAVACHRSNFQQPRRLRKMEEIIITGLLVIRKILIYSGFVALAETELRSGAATSPTFSISCTIVTTFSGSLGGAVAVERATSLKKTIINTDRQC